jgi:hypothetical protein
LYCDEITLEMSPVLFEVWKWTWFLGVGIHRCCHEGYCKAPSNHGVNGMKGKNESILSKTEVFAYVNLKYLTSAKNEIL